MAGIEVRQVTKLFGPHPETALELIAAGADKTTILSKTGCSVGLRDINLGIPQGGIFVVMGSSGSGKSTLIRLINRLIAPTSGTIMVDGADITRYAPPALREFRRRSVSMVFQGFALFPHRTVLHNVMFGLSVRGEQTDFARATAMTWIAAVGLAGYENAYPHQLSGGMKQRVGLARALAVDGGILLMDEPFSALDPVIRADMQDQLLALQASLHKTIVFITHDLAEAVRLGDQIAILLEGVVVQQGTPRQIIDHPANEAIARFVRISAPPLLEE